MRLILILIFSGVFVCGCSEPLPSSRTPKVDANKRYADMAAEGEPILITIQHVLISFRGTQRTKPSVTRNQVEAKQLAMEILEKAESGEDFESLVKNFSDDGSSGSTGIYKMVNYGGLGIDNPAVPQMNVYPRKDMAKAFGDVGFKLEIGELGIAEYSTSDSPYGYHVIKRLK